MVKRKVGTQESWIAHESCSWRIRSQKMIRFLMLLILFTVYSSQVTVFFGCSKKEEEKTAVATGEKKGETTVSTETIPTEFAEAYKGVLVVSEVEGVDWNRGVITAVGRGLPPQHITNPAQVRILTLRAAKLEAYNKLLETILKIKTPPDRNMKEYLDEKHVEISRIEGFIKGARVVKEEYKDDGSVEITIEIPITGVSGLVAVLKEKG